MKRFALHLLSLVIVAGVTATVPGGPVLAEEQKVDLDESFHIPHGDGHGLSHTPALVFTQGGGRMVVATADKEVVVFDAKTRGILKRHELGLKATDAVREYCAEVMDETGIIEVFAQLDYDRPPDLAARQEVSSN